MKELSIAKMLKILCAYKGTNVSRMGAALGLSKENIHTQLKRDNFRVNDVIKLADAIGYEVELRFVDRESGKVIEAE